MLAIMRVLSCPSIAFSSPGSWTQFLADRMRWVIALDPGDLAPKVLAMPNVLHLAKKAEDFSVADDYTTSKLPALDGNLGFGVGRRPVPPLLSPDRCRWQWHHGCQQRHGEPVVLEPWHQLRFSFLSPPRR